MNDMNILYTDKLTPIRISAIQRYYRRRHKKEMRKLKIERILK